MIKSRYLLVLIITADLILAAIGLQQLLNPSVEIKWTTASEVDTLGYRVYRGNTVDGPFNTLITPELVEASGSALTGGKYKIRDFSIHNGKTYYYLLEEVQLGGGVESFGPITIRAMSLGWLELAIAAGIAISILFFEWQRKRSFMRGLDS